MKRIILFVLLLSITAHAENVFFRPDTVYTERKIGQDDWVTVRMVNTTDDSVEFSLRGYPGPYPPDRTEGIVLSNDSVFITIHVEDIDEHGYCTEEGNYRIAYNTSDPADSIIRFWLIDSPALPEPPVIEILNPVGGERYQTGDTLNVEFYVLHTGCRQSSGLVYMESITGEEIFNYTIWGIMGYHDFDYTIPELEDTLFYIGGFIDDFGGSAYDTTDYIIITPHISAIDENKLIESTICNSYPNPFNSSTVITFSLDQQSDTKLNIYNLRGELIETLVVKRLHKGQHQYIWNASAYSSGIYFLRLTIDNRQFTKRLTLLK